MRKIETKDIFNILPVNIKNTLKQVLYSDKLQEIRIRADKPIIVQIGNKEIISEYIASEQDLKMIVQHISNYSVYAFQEEIKNGYITIKGGHRIGICGRCVVENNQIKTIKNIASINFRICREITGCSNKIMKYLIEAGEVINTIIISPPKCGKTTIIRDVTKNISNGIKNYNLPGKKVCVIDERSELGACYFGIPQMDLGVRTDILDGCPKSQGIIMAIRSMAPEVIVCDEIGTNKDVESVLIALNSGVSLITTIHGFGVEDLYNRPVFKDIVENKVFKRAIVLSNRKGAGTVESVFDFSKQDVIWEEKYA